MAEVITSIDSNIKNGICPDGIIKFLVVFGFGHSGPLSRYIDMLDEPHQKLHLAANNMTKLDVYGALDASDGYDGFEKTGGGERQGGETQINFLKTSQYGIPASDGNGYSYCSPIKWKRFRIKNVTKEQ